MAKRIGRLESAGIGNEAVKQRTGMSWAQWIARIDRAGGKALTHQEIVAFLAERYGIKAWWGQMITVGYEQARGKRQKHETPSGFRATVSRTIAVPVARVYDAWIKPSQRAKWLGRGSFSIRKANVHRSLRLTWADGPTQVEVNFYGKGAAKVQVSLSHTRLRSEKDVQARKAFWKGALGRLQAMLARAPRARRSGG
jgi:hypothetical protein